MNERGEPGKPGEPSDRSGKGGKGGEGGAGGAGDPRGAGGAGGVGGVGASGKFVRLDHFQNLRPWLGHIVLIVALLGGGIWTYHQNVVNRDNQIRANCADQHTTINFLKLFLSEGTKQFDVRIPNHPDLKALREAQESLEYMRQVTPGLLDKADCNPEELP
jgi:hypothetical protein